MFRFRCYKNNYNFIIKWLLTREHFLFVSFIPAENMTCICKRVKKHKRNLLITIFLNSRYNLTGQINTTKDEPKC